MNSSMNAAGAGMTRFGMRLWLAALVVLPGVAMAQAAGADQPADALVPPTSASDFTAAQLDEMIAGDWRSEANRARDVYRHPKESLQFFGIRPDRDVIEITPGGGWYSEILAPLLHDNGRYVAAIPMPAPGRGENALRRKFAADVEHYGHAQFVVFDPAAPSFGARGTADMVLTFRNVHNWVAGSSEEADTAAAMFRAFFDVLKPGGVLGVVEHRAADGSALDTSTGYLPTAYVVKLATDAGFTLDGSSEINANPKDTRVHPKGVWTLPPTLALGDQDREKYLEIGESDRMTLRFIKPQESPMMAPMTVDR